MLEGKCERGQEILSKEDKHENLISDQLAVYAAKVCILNILLFMKNIDFNFTK